MPADTTHAAAAASAAHPDAGAEARPPAAAEIHLVTALSVAGEKLMFQSGRVFEQQLGWEDGHRITPRLWDDIVETTQKLLAGLGRFQAARPEFRLVPRTEDAAGAEQKLAQIQREAAAIADALGVRGLVDFADDVRMLTKL